MVWRGLSYTESRFCLCLEGGGPCHLAVCTSRLPDDMCPFFFVPVLDHPRRFSRRKRGRRGGIKRRVKKLCLDDRRRLPPLPSVFLSNAQSLRRNIDELEGLAKLKSEIAECCLLAITETWLNESDLVELALTGFGCLIRLDRSAELTDMSRGGGVCFYVNERYCKA